MQSQISSHGYILPRKDLDKFLDGELWPGILVRTFKYGSYWAEDICNPRFNSTKNSYKLYGEWFTDTVNFLQRSKG